MAAEALATTGDKGVRLLTEAYNDGNRTVRDRAVWGLGRTGPDAREQVVPTLIGALDDEDTDVRRTVAWALREVTGRDFGDEPKRWSEWWAQER